MISQGSTTTTNHDSNSDENNNTTSTMTMTMTTGIATGAITQAAPHKNATKATNSRNNGESCKQHSKQNHSHKLFVERVDGGTTVHVLRACKWIDVLLLHHRLLCEHPWLCLHGHHRLLRRERVRLSHRGGEIRRGGREISRCVHEVICRLAVG